MLPSSHRRRVARIAARRDARGITAVRILLIALVVATPPLFAQERLLPGTTWTAQPAFQAWHFATALSDDSLRVTGAWQLSAPLSVAVPLGASWSFDLTGALTSGSVSLAGGRSALALSGLTDVKLRLVGRVIGDNVLVTLGATAPTGKTGLNDQETAAIRVLGAPALRFPTPVLGSGPGGTAGLILAREVGGAAWALGVSYERRGSYTPLEASIAGVRSSTELTPGGAAHLSLGVDEVVGQGRMSAMVVGDYYAKDALALTGGAGPAERGSYQLGPAVSALWQLELAPAGWRSVVITAADRYRASFKDGAGAMVEGSNGNTFDAGVTAVLGRARGVGLVLGLDARVQSGLAVDNTIATAAGTTAGLTLGLDLPLGPGAARSLRPFVRGLFGSIDTGLQSTTATGFAAGVTLVAR